MKKIYFSLIFILVLVSACAPSPEMVQTAIAQTEEAAPTETPVPTNTPAPTKTPEPTNTPLPTETNTPEPITAGIPGIGRKELISVVFEDQLDLECKSSLTDEGIYYTLCEKSQYDIDKFWMINVTILSSYEDTVDQLLIITFPFTTEKSHQSCQEFIASMAAIPFTNSTPDDSYDWSLSLIDDIVPDSTIEVKETKSFSGVKFDLTADKSSYILILDGGIY